MLVFFTFATIACGWAFQLDPGIENCIHVFYLMTPNGTSQSSVRNEVVAKAQLRASEGRTQPRDSLPCPVNVEKEIEPPSKVDADEMRRLRGSSKNVAKPRNERLAPLKSTSVSSSRVFRGQSVRKIGVFKALLWTDWTAVRQLYMALRLPTAHMKEVKGTRNKRGKYARWASLVLSAAYAVQFQLPYLVLLEDDSVWPPLRQLQLGVAQALRHIPGNGNSTRVIKLSKWGEGYVFPLQVPLFSFFFFFLFHFECRVHCFFVAASVHLDHISLCCTFNKYLSGDRLRNCF